MTSNPSIFEKAILDSDDYEDEIAEAKGKDLTPQAIYEKIAIHDVQLACDVLASGLGRELTTRTDSSRWRSPPTWPTTRHRSIEAARDFWKRVNRPNVMIKIPGTPEGLGAVEQAIYEGINVNVTLLFAVEAYEKVAEAYLTGLERRLRREQAARRRLGGQLLRLPRRHRRRQAAGGQRPRGAATARRRSPTPALAYKKFEEIFSGPRWEALHHAGAHYQRPLWASTGVKNDRYPDTMYVDELVGAHTVNTMPLATLEAVADHGHITGPTAQHDPQAELEALAEAGIDMSEVTDELLVDGVKQFEEAMNRLLAGIEERSSTTPPCTGQRHGA